MSEPAARIICSAEVDRLLAPVGGPASWQPDCACEAGAVALPPHPAAPLDPALRPRPCPALYQDAATVPGQRIVFNPIAGEGISLLNPAAARIFDLIDGERSAGAIAAAIADPAAATAGLPMVLEVLERLRAQRLIYTGDTPPQPTHRTPSHLGVWLHVTNQCNLRCTYCYVSKTNAHLPLDLGRRAIRSVFDAVRVRPITDLTLKYAGGEALLEAETIWALDAYARELAGDTIQVKSILLTNGTPLRPPIITELQRHNFQLAISLDGLGATHDAQRPLRGGQPSFRLVQRGLEAARVAGLPLSVSVVVGPGNLATLPELVDYLLERDLRFTLTFLRDSSAAQAHLAEHDAALIAGMDAAYTRIACRPPRFSVMNAALDRVQLESPHFAACGIGESYVVIKHTGEVASCQMHLDRPAGHIRQGDVLTLVAQRTPERPPGTTVDDHAGCRTCQWRYRCAGGCPIVTFRTYGRADQPSPFCGVYQTLIPRLVALEGLRLARYGMQPTDPLPQ